MKSILCNGYCVEITKKFGMSHPCPEYWDVKQIIIYDPLSDLDGMDERIVVQYLYDEGFIEDRRTEVEVRRGKYYEGDGEGI